MNKKKATSSMMGLWIGAGVAIGIATHQLALWLAIGVALGAAMFGVARRRAKDDEAAGPQ